MAIGGGSSGVHFKGCIIFIISVFVCIKVSAAPSAGDLLMACEHSLIHGFEGIEGEMCAWYITPCDCDYGEEYEIPRVCLTDSVTTEELARHVISGLKTHPELHSEDANYAAAVILSGIYPCVQQSSSP
jgi:hypothetical protein